MTPPGLSRRLPVALIGGPAVLALTFVGGLPFLVLVGVIALRAQWEVLRLYAPEPGLGVLRVLVLLVGAALLADVWWGAGTNALPILVVGTLVALTVQVFLPAEAATAGAVGGGLGSWLYIVLPLAHLLWLRGQPGPAGTILEGAWLVSALWLLVWTFDTAAYFIGCAWGKHKLIPSVSPAKSWEGTLGGFAAAVVVGEVLASAVPSLSWTLLDGALVGLLVGAGGLLGDLAESRLKRGAGLKDAGTVLAGHGGVLDRFDSMIFCAPLIYWSSLLAGWLGRHWF